MIKAMQLEWMKWRRSPVLIFIAVAVLAAPLLSMMSTYLKLNNNGPSVHWIDFVSLALQINHLFIFPLAFGALTAFTFVQEYQHRTVINLFTMPNSRATLMMAKTGAVLITILGIICFSHVATILAGSLFFPQQTLSVFFHYLPVTFKAGIIQCLLLPIFICVAVISRHFVPPLIAAGVMIMLDFLSIAIPNAGVYVFTALPYYVILKSIGWYDQPIPFIWEILIPVFIVLMAVVVYVVKKQEIH
jgi:bacitracin transport system permease protein